MTLSRRGFFTGLAAVAVTAPSIVRSASLMPVKQMLIVPTPRTYNQDIIYSNRVIRHWMDVQAIRDRNILWVFPDCADDVPCPMFREIPIHMVEAA